MRRRGKRGPNNSESTGKVGQELPKYADNQPIPLRPQYPEDEMAAAEGQDPSGEEHHDEDGPEDAEQSGSGSPANSADGAQDRPGRRRRRRRRKGGKPETAANPASVSAAGTEPGLTASKDDADAEDDGPEADASGEEAAEPVSAMHASDSSDAEPAGKLEHETQPDQMDTPPAEAPSVAARSPRGFVVLAIGLPGSGKTTWFKRRGVLPLSSDMLRSILFDDITEQRYQGLVFSTLRSLLRARLVAKMPWNYVDATNLSPHERRQWIKMAKSFGYDVQAVFFDVPLEVCLMRNQKRERRVSDDIITVMAQRLRPPHFREGFSKITVVRVKAKDGQPSLPEAPEAFVGRPEASDEAAAESARHSEG